MNTLHRCTLATMLALVGFTASHGQTPPATMSPEAAAYLNNALDEMSRLSVKRDEIDWTRLRAETLGRARDAQSPEDTYDALRFALREINDGHSFLYVPPRPDASDASSSDDDGDAWVIASTSDDLTSRRLGDDVGYVLVPSFGGDASWDPAAANAFAERVQSAIEAVDSDTIQGWVIDLRFNSGGNMWPMLAGLSPFLNEGTVGYFVGTGGRDVPWICAWGSAGTPGSKSAEVAEPYTLQTPSVPVAVLTGIYCLSSGEAVVTAFRHRPNTRSFGRPTGGASTATQPIWLGDGAMVFLTTAIYADRTRDVLGGPIAPDVEVVGGPKEAADLAEVAEGADPFEGDPVIEAAMTWLRAQADASK